ncbi:HAD family hydrolase [Candidatus Borrarchaeum sp.]|uniref:HAD family hydrolase n=1 Tax=Candidatus Borrarchaeum sp. TaxID=2846742 RepID=UPI00257E02CA|nr:HAD hydrolase family protein [Candidatus Borrarchaeum sp.]
MIEIEIPSLGKIGISTIVFDLNGTLAMTGQISDNVKTRLKLLANSVRVIIASADTRGNLADIGKELSVETHRLTLDLPEDEEKRLLIEKLGAENTAAVGNGINDSKMLKAAKIGIAVIGKEGAAVETINNANIVVTDPAHALDLFLHPIILKSTLRK